MTVIYSLFHITKDNLIIHIHLKYIKWIVEFYEKK